MRSTQGPTAAADPLALDQQVCFAVVVAARSVVALYRPMLEPTGADPPAVPGDARPVAARATVGEAALELLQLDPGTLSPLLKRLEAADLIVRRRSVTDERHLAVELTDRGRALRERALQVPPAVIDRLGMPIDELRALHSALSRVIEAAGPSSIQAVR